MPLSQCWQISLFRVYVVSIDNQLKSVFVKAMTPVSAVNLGETQSEGVMSAQMAAVAWRVPKAVFPRALIACLLTILTFHCSLAAPGPPLIVFIHTSAFFAHLISQGSLLYREHKVTHYHKLSTWYLLRLICTSITLYIPQRLKITQV